MPKRQTRFVSLAIVLAALSAGCVSTPFKGIPASTLTDDQLISELGSVYAQLGASAVGLGQLRSMLPPPDLRITAQSFTSIYLTTNFVADTAYTSGSAYTTTRYDVYDANEISRSLNQIAQGIQLGRMRELNARRAALETEYESRIAYRRLRAREMHDAIAGFFTDHPRLREETRLLETILPWEEADYFRETLARLAFEAERVVADREAGVSTGRWYGTLELRVETPDGSAGTPEAFPLRGNLSEDASGRLVINLSSKSGGKVVVSDLTSGPTLKWNGSLVMERNAEPIRAGASAARVSALVTGDLDKRYIWLRFEKAYPAGDRLVGFLSLQR